MLGPERQRESESACLPQAAFPCFPPQHHGGTCFVLILGRIILWYLLICACTHTHTLHSGQLARVRSLPPPCESWGLISGHQVWHPAPLLTEPSHRSRIANLLNELSLFSGLSSGHVNLSPLRRVKSAHSSAATLHG